MSQVCRRRATLLKSASQLIPKVFDGVEVWAVCGPLHSVDTSSLDKHVDCSGVMGPGIVVLKDCMRSKLVKGRKHQGLQNLGLVADTIQVPIHVVENRSVACAYATPNHDGSPTIPVPFKDSFISKPLTMPPPDPVASIGRI